MNFISEDFHVNDLDSYTLYIQSVLNIDYLIVVNEQNDVLVNIEFDTMNPSSEAVDLLGYSFANVIVSLPHQNLIWVPTEVYDEAEKHLFLPYFIQDDVDAINAKQVDDLNVTALYQYDQLLVGRWKKLFPEVKIVPHFDVFLHQSKPFIAKDGAVLGVHIYGNQADVFLFVNAEFKFYNTFEIGTADDLSYFVLSIMKNFSIEGPFQKILLSSVDPSTEWLIRMASYTEELIKLQAINKWNSGNEEVIQSLGSLNLLVDSSLCV